MKAHRFTLFCARLATLLLFWPGVSLAQDTYSTGWSTVTGGGALRTGAGEFTVSGAIGQFSAGTAPVGPSGEFALTGGFWTLPPGGAGGGTNADLAAIIISDGALDPSFQPVTTAYTATVSPDTTSLTVSPFASDESATLQVRINGGSYVSIPSGGTTAPLPLNTGSNPIEILVTAPGGSTTKLYTLTATRTPPGASGQVDALNADVGGFTVNATVVDPEERVLIGGSFSTVLGTPRSHIARLRADGTLDSGFNPQAGGDVTSVAVQPDGRILLGGSFTTMGGQSRSRLARVNSDGTLDTAFNPAPDNFVLCVVPDGNGKILVGGGFTNVQGQARAYLARLNADGTLDSAFVPAIGGVVNCLAVQPDGKILIGGAFTTAGGQTRNRLARLNANGALDTGFDPNADNQIGSLTVLPDGKILIGGFFSTMSGQSRPWLARVLASGALDNSFQPNPSNFVTAAAVQSDGKILISGAFTTVDGQTRNRVARLHPGGTLDNGFAPDANGNVFSVALQGNGQVLLGGEFFTVNGATRNRFARIHNDSAVRQLTVPDDTRILWTRGGSAPDFTGVTFESYTGSTWEFLGQGTRVAATSNWELTGLYLPGTGTIRARGRTGTGYLSASGGLVEQVSSYAMSSNANLSALSLSNGVLTPAFAPATTAYSTSVSNATTSLTVAVTRAEAQATVLMRINGGGWYFVAPGTASPLPLVPGNNTFEILVTAPDDVTTKLYTLIAERRVSALPGEVENLNADVSGYTVYSLVEDPEERILIAGFFTDVQGAPRSNIARLLSDGALDAGFNPGAGGAVVSVAVQPDGRILLGGSFTTMGGQSRNGLARVHNDGTLDTAFNPAPDSSVNCVVPDGSGKILIGGTFTTLQGQSRPYLARLNPDGTLDLSFTPAIGGVIYCLAVQPDGKILIGGAFTTAGGQARNYIARLNANGTLDTGFDPNSNSAVGAINVLPDGKILLGGFFTAMSGQSRPFLARVLGTGALDNSFQPNPSHPVTSAVVQSDGKILIGGAFTAVGGTNRGHVARLHPDGTLDTGFASDANENVHAVALQGNGQVLLGGEFGTVNGAIRTRLARIQNDSAIRQLTVPDDSRILWTRGGSAPDFTQVTFESYTGTAWDPIGQGTRVASTSNWELTGLNVIGSGTIRARGRTFGGFLNGSSGLIEQQQSYSFPTGYAYWASINIPSGQDATFTGDWNGDGFSNGLTYIFGTAITSFTSPGGITAPPSTPADVDLYLERSTTLAAGRWTPIASWVKGDAPTFASGVTLLSGTVRDTFSGPRAYYRYRAAAFPAPTYSTDAGGGVTTDLFDTAQGTNVIQTTPVLPFGGESIREAFGAFAGVEGGNVMFADGAPLGTTDTVFWQTAGFVNLSSIELRFAQDGLDPNRSTAAYTLSTSSDGINFTPVSTGAVPLAGGPGTAMVNAPLLITDAALSGPVIGVRGFRLDIVRNSTSGPRLVEADGFGTAGVQTTNYFDPLAFNAASNTHYTGQGGDDQSPGMAVNFSSTTTVIGGTDDVEGAFGNNNGPIEPDDVIFAAGGTPDNGNALFGDGGEFVDFIAWETTAPITLAGFRISLAGDQVSSLRDTELIRFLVEGVEVDLFDNNGADSTVERLFAGGPVTGNHFRIEFTRTTTDGPRISEIDAILGVITAP